MWCACVFVCVHACMPVCVCFHQPAEIPLELKISVLMVSFYCKLHHEFMIWMSFFFFLLLDFDSYVSIIFLLLLIFYLHVWTPHPHTLTDHILKCSHMHACTHTHTHTCIHMHTCIHTHTCMLKYTHNTLFQRFCWSMECPVWYVNNINDLQC